MAQKPAIGFVAVPGRRQATLEVAKQLEQEGFTGLYCPSLGDGMAVCEALAYVTHDIPFGTSIANIYARHPHDFAQTAAFIHEISNGRFRFGIGVSHGPTHERMGIKVGKPLGEMRQFVSDLHEGAKMAGELPPVILATLRKRMVQLSAEISDGAVWANAARSHMSESLQEVPPAKMADENFFVGNMVPTCISDDKEAAIAVLRRVLTGYVRLPNYQNYWIEAGYEEEMLAIREALSNHEIEKLPDLMSERWLSQVTLYGTAAEVREGVEAWYDTGVKTVIVVPSSAHGNQMVAFQDMIEAFR
ncbi:MAG: LLM class flavin-dependent oxidoreductase [Candidatus Tectomicrobia bacterium]|nr:LLM class flavin-dependent oxidoreductase [Candidatus Tectomicrobia bacterium]